MPARGGRHQYQSRFGLVGTTGLDEPRVLVGRVVDDEVHDELHAALVQRGDQLVEVVERAEQRVDVLVVADVVAVVVLRRAVDRREPDDVDAELVQVVEALRGRRAGRRCRRRRSPRTSAGRPGRRRPGSTTAHPRRLQLTCPSWPGKGTAASRPGASPWPTTSPPFVAERTGRPLLRGIGVALPRRDGRGPRAVVSTHSWSGTLELVRHRAGPRGRRRRAAILLLVCRITVGGRTGRRRPPVAFTPTRYVQAPRGWPTSSSRPGRPACARAATSGAAPG